MTDNEIIQGIEAIANDPKAYPGGVLPTTGGRVKVSGAIRGTPTSVIVDPPNNEVITAWPEGVPRNP